jgi:large subunit ribosomal protein L31
MKQAIHPNYRPVVFKDNGSDFAFLTNSTLSSDQTIKWEDGLEYPLFLMELSSASHPVYTGKEKLVDTAGRVDRFKARQAEAAKRLAEQTPKKPRVKNSDEDTEQ